MSAFGQKQTCALQKACPLYPRKRTYAGLLKASLYGSSGNSSRIPPPPNAASTGADIA